MAHPSGAPEGDQTPQLRRIIRCAREQLGAEPAYLWAKFPTYFVLRHGDRGKWFAVSGTVSREKLGLSGAVPLPILVVKCDPILLGSLLGTKGFLPAYHMSKTNWVTICLDDTVSDDTVINLLTISYDLTKPLK